MDPGEFLQPLFTGGCNGSTALSGTVNLTSGNRRQATTASSNKSLQCVDLACSKFCPRNSRLLRWGQRLAKQRHKRRCLLDRPCRILARNRIACVVGEATQALYFIDCATRFGGEQIGFHEM